MTSSRSVFWWLIFHTHYTMPYESKCRTSFVSLLNDDSLTGAWGCYFMQLPGDQVQGVIKLLWHELCCGFGILFIFSHAVVFMVSKLGQQQTKWVGQGKRGKSALCLPALGPLPAPVLTMGVRWVPCCIPKHDLGSESMKYCTGTRSFAQWPGRKLKYRQMKSSLGIMASS